ncbi:DUF3473 domain-containing protein, partial [Thiospirillum jenense]|nr:DUF3473 domain-containing protein [Thiospirillum jenense]
MTVDVEDYFQVSAFEKHIARDRWDYLPCRIERNMDLILKLFDETQIKATFFVLGWIAERYPNMIRRLVDAGHELASHGYEHKRIIYQTPLEFRVDIRRTKALLEDLAGVAVIGYRAASYSINQDNQWAHEELCAAGYLYSSSIYPIRHDLYGIPNAPRFRYFPIVKEPGFSEIPISTVELFKKRFPCGGGGYFRLYPYAISQAAIARVNQYEQQPVIFYFHPWELDPNQPRQSGISIKTRFRHYFNLHRMAQRLRHLLADFSWDRMDRVFLGSVSIHPCV